jgi:hypothetical protein
MQARALLSAIYGQSALVVASSLVRNASRPPPARVLASPEKFRAELADPGIARRSHLAELAAVYIAGRVGELGVIENVEEFSPNLKPH